MEVAEKQMTFSERHIELGKATEAALASIKPFLIAEARLLGTPIVVADEKGNPKFITADQLESGNY
jgi:hypothetical protein